MLARTLRINITEDQCREILVTPPSPSTSSIQLLLSKQNRSLDRINGDGNCLFRSFSKELFGDEKHHIHLRKIIMEFISINPDTFKQFLSNNSENIIEHCKTINNLGTFGTQVEIYAFSYFLNLPIYVYSMVGLASSWRWLHYRPKNTLKYNPLYSNLPLPPPDNYHIELCHINGNHFDRVTPLSHLFKSASDSPYDQYIKDFPTLAGTEDKENIIEL